MRRDSLELMRHRNDGPRRVVDRVGMFAGLVAVSFGAVPADRVLAQMPDAAGQEEPENETEGTAGEDDQGVADPDPVDLPEMAPPLEQTPEIETVEPESEDPQDNPPGEGPVPTSEPSAPVSPPEVEAAPEPALEAPTPGAAPQSDSTERKSLMAKRLQKKPRVKERAKPEGSHRPLNRPSPRQPSRPANPVGQRSPAPPRDSGAGGGSPPVGATHVASAPSPAGADTYTVRPGDTLWAIAENQLPENASEERIALQVDHLWRLNAARIGTGDPDVVLAGQRLQLR